MEELIRKFLIEAGKAKITEKPLVKKRWKTDGKVPFELIGIYYLSSNNTTIPDLGRKSVNDRKNLSEELHKWQNSLDFFAIKKNLERLLKNCPPELKHALEFIERMDSTKKNLNGATAHIRSILNNYADFDFRGKTGINSYFVFGKLNKEKFNNHSFNILSNVIFSPNYSFNNYGFFDFESQKGFVREDSIEFDAHRSIWLIKNLQQINDRFRRHGAELGAEILRKTDNKKFLKNYQIAMKYWTGLHEEGEKEAYEMTDPKSKNVLDFLKGNKTERKVQSLFLTIHPVAAELVANLKGLEYAGKIENYKNVLLIKYLLNASENFYKYPKKQMSYTYTVIDCLLQENPEEVLKQKFLKADIGSFKHESIIRIEKESFKNIQNHIRKI